MKVRRCTEPVAMTGLLDRLAGNPTGSTLPASAGAILNEAAPRRPVFWQPFFSHRPRSDLFQSSLPACSSTFKSLGAFT